jgi:hypothetical protein
VIAQADGASAALTLALTSAPDLPGLFAMPWRDSNEPTMHRPSSIAADIAGNTYVVSYVSNVNPTRRGSPHLYRIAPDNTVTPLISATTWFGQPVSDENARRLDNIVGFAVGRTGDLYFAVAQQFSATVGAPTILKITPAGVLSVVVNDQTPQTGVPETVQAPGIAGIDFDDNLYTYDSSRALFKVSPAGVVTAAATLPAGLNADKDGNTYAYDATLRKLVRTGADGSKTPVTTLPYCINGTPTAPLACLPDAPYDLIAAGGTSYVVFDGFSLRRLVLPR